MVWWLGTQALEPDCPNLNPGFDIGEFGQVTQLLCASVFPSVKWEGGIVSPSQKLIKDK